jgi:hypothetical protein
LPVVSYGGWEGAVAAKKFTIDFYRVVMPEDANATFEDVLDAVAALPANDEQRNVEIRGTPVRLHDLAIRGQRLRHGELVRIRMDEMPVRASLTGDLDPFDFEDDEGVGEETAFLYHRGLQVLVLQRNRIGVSNYGFVQYFQAHAEELLDLDGWITLEPVIEPETMARLRDTRIIRKLDVRFAGVHDPQRLAREAEDTGPAPGVSKMLDLIETFAAPAAHIELSMGHERTGTLAVDRVKRTARRLMNIGGDRRPEGQVKRIEITGKTGDDEPVFLDLLRDRMIEIGEGELDAERRLPYNVRYRALRNAYSERRDQLRALFAQPDD